MDRGVLFWFLFQLFLRPITSTVITIRHKQQHINFNDAARLLAWRFMKHAHTHAHTHTQAARSLICLSNPTGLHLGASPQIQGNLKVFHSDVSSLNRSIKQYKDLILTSQDERITSDDGVDASVRRWTVPPHHDLPCHTHSVCLVCHTHSACLVCVTHTDGRTYMNIHVTWR